MTTMLILLSAYGIVLMAILLILATITFILRQIKYQYQAMVIEAEAIKILRSELCRVGK
jgi:hypothetical protein